MCSQGIHLQAGTNDVEVSIRRIPNSLNLFQVESCEGDIPLLGIFQFLTERQLGREAELQ
jgi:hypothetical protein